MVDVSHQLFSWNSITSLRKWYWHQTVPFLDQWVWSLWHKNDKSKLIQFYASHTSNPNVHHIYIINDLLSTQIESCFFATFHIPTVDCSDYDNKVLIHFKWKWWLRALAMSKTFEKSKVSFKLNNVELFEDSWKLAAVHFHQMNVECWIFHILYLLWCKRRIRKQGRFI